MVHSIEVNQIYKEIVEQIDNWAQLGLIKSPSLGSNKTMKDLVFIPSNYATM